MNLLKSAAVLLATAAAVTGGVVATGATASAGSNAGKNVPAAVSSLPAATTATPQRVFAVMNADGTLLRGKAVASVLKLGTGVYDVRFTRNIGSCSWLGTVGLGGFSGSTGPGIVTITGRAGTNNGLFVTTYDANGTAVDLPFAADVICG